MITDDEFLPPTTAADPPVTTAASELLRRPKKPAAAINAATTSTSRSFFMGQSTCLGNGIVWACERAAAFPGTLSKQARASYRLDHQNPRQGATLSGQCPRGGS